MLNKPLKGTPYNFSHSLVNGLVGHWLFNEKGGSIVHSVLYNNRVALNNFALSGQTSNWTGSDFGGGLNFDGSDDYGLDTVGLPDLSTATYAVWCTPTSLGSGEPYKGVLVRFSSSSAKYGIFIHSSGYVYGYICDSVGTTIQVTGGTIVANTLYHIVLTYDKAGKLKLYINGAGISSSSGTGALASNLAALQIGRASDFPGRYFNGTIDEVRIYNRALSYYEVTKLYIDPFDCFKNHQFIIPQSLMYKTIDPFGQMGIFGI